MRTALAAALLAFATATAAQAQTFQDWQSDRGGRACWSASFPVSSEGERGGSPFATVTWDAAQDLKGSFAVTFGGTDVTGAVTTARIGDQSFDLITVGSNAFMRSGPHEERLLAAMREGSRMTVSWRLPGGRVQTDVYSLMGFTAASQTSAACNRLSAPGTAAPVHPSALQPSAGPAQDGSGRIIIRNR
jgi:hypothetical protein